MKITRWNSTNLVADLGERTLLAEAAAAAEGTHAAMLFRYGAPRGWSGYVPFIARGAAHLGRRALALRDAFNRHNAPCAHCDGCDAEHSEWCPLVSEGRVP